MLNQLDSEDSEGTKFKGDGDKYINKVYANSVIP